MTFARWPVCLAVFCLFSIGSSPDVLGEDAPQEEGFKQLFNGKDLTDWDGNPAFWNVTDGAITGQTTQENPTKGNTFLIWRGGEVENFELRLEFRIVGGNSGIQYRSKEDAEAGKWVIGGYQADFEAGETFSGILYEERGRGILAERGQSVEIGAEGNRRVIASLGESADIQKVIKKEEWNQYTIIADGYRFTHIINGRQTIQVHDLHKDKRTAKGLLALQLHAGPPMTVQFKNIRIREIPADQ